MAIYKKTMGDDLKLLRTDHLQGIQLLELRDSKYASSSYVVSVAMNIKTISILTILLQLPCNLYIKQHCYMYT